MSSTWIFWLNYEERARGSSGHDSETTKVPQHEWARLSSALQRRMEKVTDALDDVAPIVGSSAFPIIKPDRCRKGGFSSVILN
jgi:hypothetical protein